MVSGAVRKRAEVPAEQTWAVETVFAGPAAWEAEAEAVRAALPALAQLRGTLGQGAQPLYDCLQRRDETTRRAEKLFVWAHLRRDEDAANPQFQALAARAASLLVEVAATVAFVEPELLTLSDAQIAAYFQELPALDLYRHAIEFLLRRRAHVRSPEIEELLAQAGELGRAPTEIYTLLADADLTFPTITDERGEPIEVTQGRYLRLMESQERRVRQAAFDALYGTFDTVKNTTGATLFAAVRRNIFYARAHRYPSALDAALSANAIPVEVYHRLIATVRAHLPLLHRYLRLRRRALGLEELHMWDLYVPLVAEVDRRVEWPEGGQVVAEAVRPLGDEYVRTLRQGLASRWVDIYENEGKSPGAYSWGSYDTQPFVLMNYQDNWSSVFTLAHELGHSLHSHLARAAQPYIYGDYTTFLAEIASTLNEALLVEHLLRTSDDPQLRLFVINHQLDAFRTTLYRQTMFAEFELAIHQRVEAGGALTAEALSETYYGLVTAYHGDAAVADAPIALEWARIPHFYMNFYVFQYATGLCAAAALTEQIMAEGEPAGYRFLDLLKAGNSDYSIDLLRRAGVDMATPAPIERALAQFARRLDEAESLLASR